MTIAPAPERESKFGLWAGPALLGLCLVVSLWLIWWYFYGSIPRQRTMIVDPPRDRRALRAMAQFVRPLRDGEWFVRGYAASIFVRKQGNDFAFLWNINMAQEQQQIIWARQAALRDEKSAKRAGLTAQQIDAIRQADVSVNSKLADADRDKLMPLWSAYISAASAEKLEAGKKFAAAVDEAGKISMLPARQAMIKRTQEMTKILTPQVVGKLLHPATRPATQRAR